MTVSSWISLGLGGLMGTNLTDFHQDFTAWTGSPLKPNKFFSRLLSKGEFLRQNGFLSLGMDYAIQNIDNGFHNASQRGIIRWQRKHKPFSSLEVNPRFIRKNVNFSLDYLDFFITGIKQSDCPFKQERLSYLLDFEDYPHLIVTRYVLYRLLDTHGKRNSFNQRLHCLIADIEKRGLDSQACLFTPKLFPLYLNYLSGIKNEPIPRQQES